MRKAVIILACILCAIALFNRDAFKEDISNRTVVQGVGIDLNDDGTYTVTLETINTENYSISDGTASPVMNIRTLKGKTVYSAIKSAYSVDGKIPLMSKNRVIIIGKKLAEKGVMPALDYFVRDAENYPSVLIATVDGSAEDFFKKTTDDSSVVSRDVENIILTADEELTVSSVSLCELVNRYEDGARAFYMPIISTQKDEEKEVAISKGTAIFKEGKYVSNLSENETASLNFLCNKAQKGALEFSVDGIPVAISVINSSTFREINYDGEAPVFTVKISVKADIAEYGNKTEKNISEADIEKIKEYAEEKLKGDIEALFEKMYKSKNTDAVGLSRLMYIQYPQKYRQNIKNLNEIMNESQYSVEVKFSIRRLGQDYSA